MLNFQHDDSRIRTPTEVTAGVTPLNYAYLPGNIRRYGAVVDGSTDDSPAIRLALDVAAQSGAIAFCDPPGSIKVTSIIYIPQSVSGTGFLMDFSGCTFIGQGRGTGTIFESGTGTVSTGGATNFGQSNESAASLHYGTILRGARFRACEKAIRLFNFLKGCKLEDLYFEDVDQAVFTFRCFYLELHNCHAQVLSIDSADTLFEFTNTNNAMTIIGCEAGGGAGNTTGTGFKFTGGGAGSGGIVFHGNTAENLARGLHVTTAIEGLDIRACYFEGTSVAGIDASAAGSKSFDVEGCWFLLTTKAIYAKEWRSGRWGASNYFAGTPDTVDISDADSTCVVQVPAQSLTEAQAVSATTLPSNYTLSNSITLSAPRVAYAAASGLNSPISIDSGTHKAVPSFAYSGGAIANGASFTVPFCSQTLSSGSSVIDTQISWSTYHMHVYFGLYCEINGAKYLDGFVGWNGTVRRLDSTANITVTASDNSGKLRLTIAGSAHTGFTANGFWGQIRHV